MNKSILLAAALALGSAACAQTSSGESVGQQADRTFDRAESATSRAVNPPPGEPSIGQKADRLFDRMEGGVGRTVDSARNAGEPSRMGNAPAQR